MKTKKYFGETVFDIKDTEFKDYKKSDWVLYFIGSYGQIDGAHHKQWVLDQVARIVHGTQVIIKQARWDDGEINWRITLDEPSNEYYAWVSEMKSGEDGPETYGYDEGVAP